MINFCNLTQVFYYFTFFCCCCWEKNNLVLNYSSSKNNKKYFHATNIKDCLAVGTPLDQVLCHTVYNHIFPDTRALLHSVHRYWCLLQHTLPHFTDFIVSTQPSPLQLPASNLPCIPLTLCSSLSMLKLLLLWLKHPQM